MSALKENKTCALLEQYLSYLIVVKGRSPLTADEWGFAKADFGRSSNYRRPSVF